MCIRDRIYGIRVETIDAPHSEFQYINSDIDKIIVEDKTAKPIWARFYGCLLYTSDAADERSSVDLGGRRIIQKKNTEKK